MKHIILPLLCLCYFSLTIHQAQAQKQQITSDANTLKGMHSIKINLLNTNPYEIGTGLSYQYYPSRDVGLQINADVLFPTPIDWDEEEYGIHGLGLRLNPEIRFYPRRRSGERFNSFFIGAGPMYKYMKMNEQRWQRIYPETGNSYKQFTDNQYINNSIGLMGRVGIELLFGEPKRWLTEISYGFGLTQNFVKYKGDGSPYDNWRFLDDIISTTNRKGGFSPYIDLKIVVGYNFNTKK